MWSNGATTASINVTTSGSYTVEITDANGCTSPASAATTVTVNPLPTILTQPTALQSICVGGSVNAVTVAYTGGVGTATYQWFSNTTPLNTTIPVPTIQNYSIKNDSIPKIAPAVPVEKTE